MLGEPDGGTLGSPLVARRKLCRTIISCTKFFPWVKRARLPGRKELVASDNYWQAWFRWDVFPLDCDVQHLKDSVKAAVKTNKPMPKTSVIAPNYNHTRRRRMNSIVTETLKDIELTLVDDCSTDEGLSRTPGRSTAAWDWPQTASIHYKCGHLARTSAGRGILVQRVVAARVVKMVIARRISAFTA